MKKLLLLLALMVCSFKAKAQLVAEWNCDNTVAPTFIDPLFVSSANNLTSFGGVTMSAIPYPNGCPGPAPDRGSNWVGMNTPLDLSRYIEVAIVASQDIVLTLFDIKTRRTSNGATNWQLRWSVDGYSNPIYATGSLSTVCTSHSIGLPANLITSGNSASFRIYAFGASSSTAGFVIDDVQIYSITSTLPVSLLSFTGEAVGNTSLLKWTTATERNSSHFQVMRSTDTEVWEEVGRVSGAGDSQSVIDYSFVDRNPETGTNYYQLVQTDFDGTTEAFHIVPVRIGRSLAQVFPNPGVAGELVKVSGDFDSIVAHDQLGRVVPHRNMSSGFVIEKPGTYFVTVVSENETSVHRVTLY